MMPGERYWLGMRSFGGALTDACPLHPLSVHKLSPISMDRPLVVTFRDATAAQVLLNPIGLLVGRRSRQGNHAVVDLMYDFWDATANRTICKK
jgi:hypothetical protein